MLTENIKNKGKKHLIYKYDLNAWAKIIAKA